MAGWRDSATHWGPVTRALHWLVAAMVLVQVPLGFLMVEAYDAWLAGRGDTARVMVFARLHDTNGLLVMALALLRLSWRLGNPAPGLPAGLPAWQRLVARATHAALYALLLAFPLSGWAALSAYDGEFPIFFFGWDDVWRIVPRAAPGSFLDSDLFGGIHEACWKVGAGILLLHVSAAAWHGWVRRDGVLARMWRGQAAAPLSPAPPDDL